MNEDRNDIKQRIANCETAIIDTADPRTRQALDSHLSELRDRLESIEAEERATRPTPRHERPYAARRLDFILENGTAAVTLKPGVVLFETGAYIVTTPMGENLYAPPTDPTARLALRRQFHDLTLAPAVRDFDHLKAALTGEGVPFRWTDREVALYGPASRDGETDLKAIRAVVVRHRAAIDEIDSELTRLPQEQARREQQKRDRDIAQQIASRQFEEAARVNAVTI